VLVVEQARALIEECRQVVADNVNNKADVGRLTAPGAEDIDADWGQIISHTSFC
jgi:hypothetical protein